MAKKRQRDRWGRAPDTIVVGLNERMEIARREDRRGYLGKVVGETRPWVRHRWELAKRIGVTLYAYRKRRIGDARDLPYADRSRVFLVAYPNGVPLRTLDERGTTTFIFAIRKRAVEAVEARRRLGEKGYQIVTYIRTGVA